MSLGTKPPNEEAPTAVNGNAVKTEAPLTLPDPIGEQVNGVLNSEVSFQGRKSGISLT
jgi:hypothetical protein